MGTLKAKEKRQGAAFVQPMLLKLVRHLPQGARWQYEVKWDGYRGIAILNEGRAQFISRNEKDLSKRFPRIIEAVKNLEITSAVIDGEIVMLDE